VTEPEQSCQLAEGGRSVVEDDRLLGDALSAGWRQTGEVVDWFRSGEPADDALDGASYMIASRGRRRSV